MTSTSHPTPLIVQLHACWIGMSIALISGATQIEASPLSCRCSEASRTCLESTEQLETSDFTTLDMKKESDFCIQRFAYVQQAIPFSEGEAEEKSLGGNEDLDPTRNDRDIADKKNMRAELKSNIFDSFAAPSAADPLAFEGFEIDTADEAERTAVMRALSEATWQEQDDIEKIGWTKRTVAEESSNEEEEITLDEISSNGSFLVPEPSSLMTWAVAGLFIATAIYRKRRNRRVANS